MFKGVKQWLDDCAIKMATATLPKANPRPGQLAEAEAILNSPDLFRLPEMPADLSFESSRDFAFDSLDPSPWPSNNRVSGSLYRAGKNWREKPLVLLIHGWNAELQYAFEFPLLAGGFTCRGVNAARFWLPYHGLRRPRELGAVRNFICDDIPVMLRATRQTLSDIHAFLLWARQQGCPGVGTWGFSFGAWLTGLHLCMSNVQTAAVLTTPISDMRQAIQDLAFCFPIRAALQSTPLDVSRLNLFSYRPQIAPSQILLIHSEYDRFVSEESLRQLSAAWGNPQVSIVRQSHISILISPTVLRRATRWCVNHLHHFPHPVSQGFS